MVQAHSSLGTGGLTDYQHKIEVEPWKQVESGWNRVGLEVESGLKAGQKRVRIEFESSQARAEAPTEIRARVN